MKYKTYYQDKQGNIIVNESDSGLPSEHDKPLSTKLTEAVKEDIKKNSGQMFKTINGESIIGKGNIEIAAGISAGPQGEQGPMGLMGPTGPQGLQGEQGPQGPKGDKGDAFTYEDFTPEQLEALRGPQGETGPQGPAGTNGTDGAVGKGLSIKSSGADCTEVGDAYMDNQGHLQVLTDENTWTDVGSIRGPQGIQGERGPQGVPGVPGYISSFVPNAGMATEVGQAYVDEDGRLQVCTSINPKEFEDAGYIRGTRGIQGPQGEKGDRGDDGYVKGFRYSEEAIEEVGEAYVDSNGDVHVCTSLEPLTFKDWGNIKGPAGANGPKGEKGDTGATGYVKRFVTDYSRVEEIGDAYVNVNNGHLYVCTSIDPKQFDDVGDIRGPQGPRGYTGEKGDKGDKGDTGNVSAFFFSADEVTEVGQAYLDENGNVQVCSSLEPKTFENKGSLKGPRGVQGPRGAKGDLGYVKSFVPSAIAVTSVGQAYIDNNNHLQVCVAIEPTITFEDAGVIQGPQGVKGDKGDAFEYEDFTEAQLEALRGPQGIQGVQGAQGPKGDPGEGFSIYRTYGSIALMEADAENVPEGKFVLISSTVEDPDNAKLYVKGSEAFSYLTDLSAADAIDPATLEAVQQAVEQKQDRLVSSENIKTVNGESLLGEGNIEIEGGEGEYETIIKKTGGRPIITLPKANPDKMIEITRDLVSDARSWRYTPGIAVLRFNTSKSIAEVNELLAAVFAAEESYLQQAEASQEEQSEPIIVDEGTHGLISIPDLDSEAEEHGVLGTGYMVFGQKQTHLTK